ncbi:hypothetical protein SJS40_16315 [Aeromonas caviae]|uniref:hypothetical protein n=1 Tax=Aeromonas caviae TaxID=648 RepID=UPI0029DBFF3E|nr:hypothetical protein [Aeromonas caviae]MDX7755087.1 hypothetical protein [Aeromonas caviae]MDX7774707.1 hypothetical protein [Aeromonas caviae]
MVDQEPIKNRFVLDVMAANKSRIAHHRPYAIPPIKQDREAAIIAECEGFGLGMYTNGGLE